MKSYLAVLTADCHLQERAWANYRELAGDALYGFEQLVSLAIERRLPLVAAGDLLDKPRNDSKVPHFLRRQLNRLNKARVPFYYIQGQDTHDRQNGTPWASAVSAWAQHVHGKSVDIGAQMYGLDWQPRHELPGALATIPEDTEVLVMHQVTLQLMRINYELDVNHVPHAKVLVVGDYHKSVLGEYKGAQGQPLLVYSPGATCLQAKDEDEHKSCGLLWRDGDEFGIDRVELLTRPVIRVEPLVFENELDDFVGTIAARIQRARDRAVSLPERLQKPLVVVKFSRQLDNAYKRIRGAIGDEAFLMSDWLASAESQREKLDSEAVVESDGDQPYSLLDALNDRGLDRESPEYQLAAMLLSGKDQREQLALFRNRMGLK